MSDSPVVALWDIENAPIPPNKFPTLWHNMETSLHKYNRNLTLDQVIAFGPRRPWNFPHRMIFEPLPDITIPCEADPKEENCEEWVVDSNTSSGVSPERNTDSADLLILIGVYKAFIKRKVKDVLIISGDGDFGDTLRKFTKKKRLNLMLAYPEEASDDIKTAPYTAFKWSINGSPNASELMINGGGPVRNMSR